jgi:uncharacterized protein YihD (DUF1040 family)|tara:strand:+ start:1216 stop:1485 length:270 start_codon:yes stop_codon:yes gene_type:complete
MYKKDSAFLIFGDQLNKIIQCLEILLQRNPNQVSLVEFIEKLENLKPYEEMLDDFIDYDINLEPDSMEADMEEMLNKLGISLPKDKGDK